MSPKTLPTRRTRSSWRAFAITALAAGTVMSMSACSFLLEDGTPTVIDTPTIVWKNGAEPSSPLEASPYVQYLRALELGKALSWNTGDFTIEQLTSTEPLPDDWEGRYVDPRNAPYVYLGPRPFEPVRLTELPPTKDGNPQVQLEVCIRQEADFLKYEIENESDQLRRFRGGHVRKYTMVYDSESKTIGEQALDTDTLCDNDAVPLGLFTPEPEVPSAPISEPVRSYDTLQPSKAPSSKPGTHPAPSPRNRVMYDKAG